MSDLVKNLRQGWGFVGTKALHEAANLIEQQQDEIERLSRLHDEWCQVFDQLEEYARANNIGSLGGCRVGGVIESHELQQAEIDALKEQFPKWVSVDELLPDNGVSVLIRNSFGEIHTCRRPVIVDTNKSWESNTGEFARPKITHWMPLPQPPKEQGDE